MKEEGEEERMDETEGPNENREERPGSCQDPDQDESSRINKFKYES